MRAGERRAAARPLLPPELSALDEYLAGFEAFFDDYAERVGYWRARNPGYHECIARTARFYVPPGARVLEIGCGTGDLLASLEPSEGVGVDLSGAMVKEATQRHPHLEFRQAAAERLELPGRVFDYIILSDLVGYLFDIRVALEHLLDGAHDHIDLEFANGVVLRYHDPRRFGAVLWLPASKTSHALLAHLGPEPLEAAFDAGAVVDVAALVALLVPYRKRLRREPGPLG